MMNLYSHMKIRIELAVFSFILVGLACNFGLRQDKVPDLTLTAMSELVARTVTLAASEKENGADELATVQVEATSTSQAIQSTQTAVASTRSEEQLAAATIAAPVIAELPLYKVDTQSGRLAWLHDPVKIEIEGYQQFNFANDYMQIIARDFVLTADITWDTQYGSSGCGFMFRSDGDKNKPNQYMLIASRIGNGHVIFTALADGQPANFQDFYAGQLDNSFQWQNQTTNRIAIVGRGLIFEIYTNGIQIGEVDVTQPPKQPKLPSKPALPTDQKNIEQVQKYQNQLKEYQELVDQVQINYKAALTNFENKEAIFEEGFVAMLALSQSGRTVCQFDDAWLWLIETP